MPKGLKRDDGDGAAVAARHGLVEGDGGYAWRDRKNAGLADACVGFLTTLEKTGRGTQMTVNIFVNGAHEWVAVRKPAGRRAGPKARPVLLFWDIAEDRLAAFAAALRDFVATWAPESVLVAGHATAKRTLAEQKQPKA
eukprot:gene10683-7913_t